jgi:DNA (cytosine-5)-methyltransferase 1
MHETVDLFAGPGGWDEGARILNLDLGITGVEKDPHAAATARAAGHTRIVADVAGLNPADFPTATGLIVSPPCPPFSAAGKRLGMGDDYAEVLDAITCLGSEDCGDACDCWTMGRFADPRSRLVVQTARWALRMPAITWLAAEQVPGVEFMWEDLAAELYAAGWEWVDVLNLDAADYGAGARRARTFLVGRRYTPSPVSPRPRTPIPATSAADVLGWPGGERMRTRNNRRPTGGNLFSTDGPSWCLTGKARSWERDSDGARMTAAEAGALQGFPRDYPWTGSRTAQFQQAGDVVSPLVGAAVLGAVLGVEWEPQVRAHAAQLAAAPVLVGDQYALFA